MDATVSLGAIRVGQRLHRHVPVSLGFNIIMLRRRENSEALSFDVTVSMQAISLRCYIYKTGMSARESEELVYKTRSIGR